MLAKIIWLNKSVIFQEREWKYVWAFSEYHRLRGHYYPSGSREHWSGPLIIHRPVHPTKPSSVLHSFLVYCQTFMQAKHLFINALTNTMRFPLVLINNIQKCIYQVEGSLYFILLTILENLSILLTTGDSPEHTHMFVAVTVISRLYTNTFSLWLKMSNINCWQNSVEYRLLLNPNLLVLG